MRKAYGEYRWFSCSIVWWGVRGDLLIGWAWVPLIDQHAQTDCCSAWAASTIIFTVGADINRRTVVQWLQVMFRSPWAWNCQVTNPCSRTRGTWAHGMSPTSGLHGAHAPTTSLKLLWQLGLLSETIGFLVLYVDPRETKYVPSMKTLRISVQSLSMLVYLPGGVDDM